MKHTQAILLLAAALTLGTGAATAAEVIAYPDGGYYKGVQVNGQRSGHGIYLYPDHSLYIGEWLAGEKDGWGLYKWPSGNIYEGEWRGGRQHGAGVLTFSDGGVFEGRWEEGVPQDEGKRPAATPIDPEAQERLCRQVRLIAEAYQEIYAGSQAEPGAAQTWALEDRCR